jgi:hypothetical protein
MPYTPSLNKRPAVWHTFLTAFGDSELHNLPFLTCKSRKFFWYTLLLFFRIHASTQFSSFYSTARLLYLAYTQHATKYTPAVHVFLYSPGGTCSCCFAAILYLLRNALPNIFYQERVYRWLLNLVTQNLHRWPPNIDFCACAAFRWALCCAKRGYPVMKLRTGGIII